MLRYLYILFFIGFISTKTAFAIVPVANFTQNSVSGCGMLVVNFHDASTGVPTSWLWDFGDGFTSTLQHPTHAYTTPGIYTVKLTASNASGSNMKTVNNLITIFARPQVSFAATTDTVGCQPLTTSFSPQTSGPAPITGYTWDFGDGQNSSLTIGNHMYNSAGVFTVTLTVRDANQCSATKTKTNYITVKPKPIAQFTANPLQACSAPLMVNFTNTSTGTGLTYHWNFGDSSPASTVQSPSHNYTSNGQFSPSLIVFNSAGCSDTISLANYINLAGFNVGFSASVTQGCNPLSTMFTANAGSDVTYTWAFGDSATGSGEQVWHEYTSSGYYNVTVIGTNENGCIDTTQLVQYIHVSSGPNISFTADDTVACKAPFLVNFTNTTPSSQSPNWTFSDGGTASGNNPSHTFNAVGSFDVTLTTSDNLGCTNSLTKPGYINIVPITATLTSDVTKGCIPLTVNFQDISTASPVATSWLWNFGDTQTSTLQNPTHIYSDTGHYNVSLTITNSEGCTNTIVMSNYIKAGIHPTSAFIGDSLFGCHPLKTNFTDQSSSFANEWHWYLGDGESQEQNPHYTFQDTGFVDVALVVSNNGCKDSLMKKEYAYVRYPKPDFSTPNPIGCSTPHSVNFSNSSQGATDYLWRFGDGSTSTATNPTHVYTNPGSYTVELRVFNDTNMCADSTTRMFLIKISSIQPGFTVYPNEICQNDSIHFFDTSATLFPFAQWKWYFGDGYADFTSGDTAIHQYLLPDTCDVRLILIDSIGCSKTVIKPQLTTVHTLPSPRFTANHTFGCPPFSVIFADQSFNPEPSTIVSWLWNFGDSTQSNAQNPTHIYADTGKYAVSLTVTDARGCDSTYLIEDYIVVSYPLPQFASDTMVCSGDTLCLVNLTEGANLNYTWDFGDGSPTSIAADVNHAFVVDSTTVMHVSLTATDTYGCSQSIQHNIIVSKPKARFTAVSQTSDCPPFNAAFVDSSSTNVVGWSWSFGDPLSSNNNESFFQNPQHLYGNSGVFDVTLSVIDDMGCQDTTSMTNYIFVDGPRGTFDFYPKNGCAPLTVTFVANAQNTADYLWVFGDGGSASGDSVTWTFTNGGFYLPVLVISDSLNTALGDTVACMVTLVSSDTVVVSQGLANFSISDSLYCINDTVFFTDLTTGSGNIGQWSWVFGDGGTSTLQNPSHIYTTSNDFEVKLTVLIDSCIQTISHWVHVFQYPNLQVQITDTIGCSPYETNFYVDPLTITSPVSTWAWTFDDNTPTIPYQNVDHQFQQSGTYNVQLNVSFANGCSTTYTLPTHVIVYPKPDAQFSFDGNFVYPNIPIHFTDLSSGDVFSWFWMMGDGNTTTVQNPTHSYPGTGYHRVTLIVTSSEGCQDSISYQIVTTEGIKIPNVFTPNNDGFNDQFYIETFGEFQIANMKIFNRWGVLIWETDSPLEFWKGKNLKGEDNPSGVYFYIYNAKAASGKLFESSGSITLIR